MELECNNNSTQKLLTKGSSCAESNEAGVDKSETLQLVESVIEGGQDVRTTILSKQELDTQRSKRATSVENYTEEPKKIKISAGVLHSDTAQFTKQFLRNSPKKRLQVDTKFENTNKRNNDKKASFIYGNYKCYYTKRNTNKKCNDPRIDMLAKQPDLLRNKEVLDIGCNSGYFSIEIVKSFGVKSLIGIDIDRKLIKFAQNSIDKLMQRMPPDSPESINKEFPFNVSFEFGNYVLADDILLEIERPQFDVILCLSVTKWIHLNFGDAGLKQAFRRMFLQLRPGGKLIVEPQPFESYHKRRKVTENIYEHYCNIKFVPEMFITYLLSPEVGFVDVELMGKPEHCTEGFKRPIQIFTKAKD